TPRWTGSPARGRRAAARPRRRSCVGRSAPSAGASPTAHPRVHHPSPRPRLICEDRRPSEGGPMPTSNSRREAPDRNLAMELVRVTEAAAMAAGRWVGRGDKNGGDGAAVDAMRQLVGTVSMRGVVVIGEGEKDEAPMLFNGEKVGNGWGPDCDVAVDPIDGTTLMSKGMPNALAVLAVTVCVLDRPRHADLVKEIRRTGARIRFISDGDVAGAISAARPTTGVDMLVGVGGTPEGVIAAAALKCMGGEIQGKLWPQTDDERSRAREAGLDLDQVLTTDELVRGNNVFFCATGVTD